MASDGLGEEEPPHPDDAEDPPHPANVTEYADSNIDTSGIFSLHLVNF